MQVSAERGIETLARNRAEGWKPDQTYNLLSENFQAGNIHLAHPEIDPD